MPPELAIAQFIASVALTLASITIATVSAVFAYRNNFGWEPIALATSIWLHGKSDGSKTYKGAVHFEIWNRRKYPIVVRRIRADFLDITIDEPPNRQYGKWYMTAAWGMYREEHTIPPQSHEKHVLEFPFTTVSIDGLNAPITFTIHYFDPRANDVREMRIEKMYTLDGVLNL